jgi:hypothetical protein
MRVMFSTQESGAAVEPIPEFATNLGAFGTAGVVPAGEWQ